jgi:hypothetical protein
VKRLPFERLRSSFSVLGLLASSHCGTREAPMGSQGADASTEAAGMDEDAAASDVASLDADTGAPDDSPDAHRCGYIEAGHVVEAFDGAPGGRMVPGMVPVCCGRVGDDPGFSCVDLSVDGGQYGALGQCLGLNEMWDGKFVSVCCDGLARVEAFALAADSGNAFVAFMLDTADAHETCVFTAGPSGVVCLPCGNGICEPPDEDICNCPAGLPTINVNP